MKLQRRKLVKVGYVNFPFKDKEYKNSGEGGMVVKLVVCGKKPRKGIYGKSWEYGVCCGAAISELMMESLVGDDKRPMPRGAKEHKTHESLIAEQELHNRWLEYYYPQVNNANDAGTDRFLSTGFAAVILMGSTGWAGYSDKKGSWVCKYSDLTPEGKKLYNMVKKMYPSQELHLLTYLDT